MRRARKDVDVVFEPVMRSRAMRELDAIVRAVAPKDVVVTFVGESGTGKEILARRVHELSERRAGPFVPINCAAIPEPLFESELFGHEKGAFTGASEQSRGKIAAADGGTLFLDEIGEMPLSMQAKLLRFLENKRFMRVGGSTKISVDTRLVCATLRPLEDEVRAGRFRADLFYRIQGITVSVPPLRDRGADILPLVQEFVLQLSSKHGTAPPKMSRAALDALRAYSWPGNVRELRNVIERVCILREGRAVRLADLPQPLRAGSRKPRERTAQDRESDGTLVVHLDRPLHILVGEVLDAALELENGNQSRAADRLGISVRTMQRHVSKGAGGRRPVDVH